MPRLSRSRLAQRQSSMSDLNQSSLADSASPQSSCITRSRLSRGEKAILTIAQNQRDAAFDRLAFEDITTSSGAAEDTLSFAHRSATSPAELRRDTTGLDLADDDLIFANLDDSFAVDDLLRRRRSADSSLLSLGHVKSRSRQSSFMGRNDPPIRPSSRGPNTPVVSAGFNIGAFRRRAREPSILGLARRPLSDAGTSALEAELDSELELELQPNPEAESTPLEGRRRTRQSLRLMAERASETPAPQSTSRKRRSLDADEGNSESLKKSCIGSDADAAEESSDSDLSVLGSLPSPPPALQARPTTPIDQDEITAPPASSDSEDNGDDWPDIHKLAKMRRRPSITTPLRPDQLSDISSPPSLTHSPNFAKQRRTRQRGRPLARDRDSPKLTTADLTNLLPKRRHRRVRDPFDPDGDAESDTTELIGDETDLSYLDSRMARRRNGSRPPSRAASRNRGYASALKPKPTPSSIRQSAQKQKTNRRRSSDKENEGVESDVDGEEGEESAFMPLPDDTFDHTPNEGDAPGSPSADELKQAAKKFVEVDQWKLEFEEVAEPSSPQDAR